MKNKDSIKPDAFAIQYGSLYAEIDGVQVLCTHNAKGIFAPYSGDYGSYEGQNLYETQLQMDFMNEKNDGSPQVLLGDLQTGEGFPEQGISERWIGSYNLITENGFVDSEPAKGEVPFCTACPSFNEQSFNNNEDIFVDNIFVRNAQVSGIERILDDEVTLTRENGETYTAFRSDHFGVQATVAVEQSYW